MRRREDEILSRRERDGNEEAAQGILINCTHRVTWEEKGGGGGGRIEPRKKGDKTSQSPKRRGSRLR